SVNSDSCHRLNRKSQAKIGSSMCVARFQWISHNVRMSSMYGSKPHDLNTRSPSRVGRRLPSEDGLAIPAASTQNRIDRTMFFPTPSSTIAWSSLAKILGSTLIACSAFGIHAYLQAKDSCPENLIGIRFPLFQYRAAQVPGIQYGQTFAESRHGL